jgi:hypothetical protein
MHLNLFGANTAAGHIVSRQRAIATVQRGKVCATHAHAQPWAWNPRHRLNGKFHPFSPGESPGARRTQRAPSAAIAAVRAAAKELRAPLDLVQDVAKNGKLPVVNFVAGGISTPADAALAMQLGAPIATYDSSDNPVQTIDRLINSSNGCNVSNASIICLMRSFERMSLSVSDFMEIKLFSFI